MKEVKHYWEVRRGQEILAYGGKETIPTRDQQKSMCDAGLKIYVEGKVYRGK